MAATTREKQLRRLTGDVSRRLVRLGDPLSARQILSGSERGNVPPWPGGNDPDFHGTLQALWIWQRAQQQTGDDRFSLSIAAGWSFVDSAWSRFVPTTLGATANDEAAYDCAMVLRASLASARGNAARTATAARLLAAHLADLDRFDGRAFADPGFLAWTLIDHARVAADRGLLAAAKRFVERAFGTKTPPAFADEPSAGGLFDFSSTTATRVLAVLAAEGETPFVGAWLRERVLPAAPTAFVARKLDENTWNACVAVSLARGFHVSTDSRFLDAYQAIMDELDRRARDGAPGRHPGREGETDAAFYCALALDALATR